MTININSDLTSVLSSTNDKTLLLYLPFYYNTTHELYINDEDSVFVVNDYIKDETNNIIGQIKEIDNKINDNRRCIVNIISNHNSFEINQTIKSCTYNGTVLTDTPPAGNTPAGVPKSAIIKQININTTMPISYYKETDGNHSTIKHDSLSVIKNNMPYLYNECNNEVILQQDSNKKLNINFAHDNSTTEKIEIDNTVNNVKFNINSSNDIKIIAGNSGINSESVSSEYKISINGDNSSHVIIKSINSNEITTMSNHGIVNGTIAMIGEVPSYISFTGKNVEINTEYIVTDKTSDTLKLSKFDKRLINVISGTKLQVKDLDTVTNYNSLNNKVVYIHNKLSNAIYKSTINSNVNANNKYDITLGAITQLYGDTVSLPDMKYSTTHEFYIYILTEVVTLPDISDLGSNIKLHYYNDNSEGIQLNDKVLIKSSSNSIIDFGSKNGGLEVDGGLLVKGKMVVSSTNKNNISLNSALYIREAMYFVPEIIDYDSSTNGLDNHDTFDPPPPQAGEESTPGKLISSTKACTILNFKSQIQTITNSGGTLQYELKNGLYNGQIKKIALHPNYETYSVKDGVSGSFPLEILINNLCDPDGQGIVDASLILNRGGQSMNLLWIENDNPFLNYPKNFTYNLENNTTQLSSDLTITTYTNNNEISFSGNLNDTTLFDNAFTLKNSNGNNDPVGNNFVKDDVYSSESYTNKCYLEFKLLKNNNGYYGLTKNKTTDKDDLDYAIHFNSSTNIIEIYEKGVRTFTHDVNWNLNEIYTIIYDGSTIKYQIYTPPVGENASNLFTKTFSNVDSNQTFHFCAIQPVDNNDNIVKVLQFGPCEYKDIDISKYTIKKSSKVDYYYLTTKLSGVTYYLHYDRNDEFMLYDSTVSKAGNSGFSTTSAEFKFTHVKSTNTLTSYGSNTSFDDGGNNQLSIYGQDNNDFAYVDNSVIASGNWILMDNNFTYM